MKVKELIEILSSFDQHKDIWILYDSFDPQVPDFVICPSDESCDECKSG